MNHTVMDDSEIVVDSRARVETALFSLWMDAFRKFKPYMSTHALEQWVLRATTYVKFPSSLFSLCHFLLIQQLH